MATFTMDIFTKRALLIFAMLQLYIDTSKVEAVLIPFRDGVLEDKRDGFITSSDRRHKCTPFIKFPNGSDTLFTISSYLSSKNLLPCHKTISKDLKEIFENTTQSSRIRAELQKSLGSLCSIFISTISVIAFKLGPEICKENSLTDALLAQQDFCSLEGLISHEIRKVLDLGSECPDRCGSGYGRVLCNAYYSVTELMNKRYPNIIASKSKERSSNDCLRRNFYCPASKADVMC